MCGGFGGMLSVRVAGGAAHARAVLGEVRVFKRATSLGGVESLIEHRRGNEGPSSLVPDDLLPMSCGIEAAEDLIARPRSRARCRCPQPGARIRGQRGDCPVTDLAAQVTDALERSVLPSVIARGGAVRIAAAGNGVVTLGQPAPRRGPVPGLHLRRGRHTARGRAGTYRCTRPATRDHRLTPVS